MPTKKQIPEAMRKKIAEARARLKAAPDGAELTPEQMADAAPFYFVLRRFISQLKQERNAHGLTLRDVAEKCELTEEYLSRLENGKLTNPTWKSLGTYALAVGCQPELTAIPGVQESRQHDPRVNKSANGQTRGIEQPKSRKVTRST